MTWLCYADSLFCFCVKHDLSFEPSGEGFVAALKRAISFSPVKKRKLAGKSLSENIPDQLVRKLIEHATNNHKQPSTLLLDIDLQQPLLDLEVDGIRCLLLRRRIKPVRKNVILSPREIEIAHMVAKGHPNKVIADVLDISPWTVSTHLRRMFTKMGVSSRAAMVAELVHENLLAKLFRDDGGPVNTH